MGDVNIRATKAADYHVLAVMMTQSYPWRRLGIGYDDLYAMVSDPLREVYVAQLDDRIVGGVIIEMMGSFTGYIKSICVSPDYRGRGIGGLLMEYAEARIFREKPNVFLCVSDFNHDAQRFYEALGYGVVGVLDDFLVSGSGEVLMRKTIAPINEFP
jgi:[ribosomal protein S18]-alanine N-acetyltransferase